MYDMYPDWGPAKHRATEDPFGAEPGTDTLERRDAAGERPDDN